MKKMLIGTVALLAVATGPALAADIPVKAPVYKAVVAPVVYSWTGCYIGGNGGGMWVRKSWTTFQPTLGSVDDGGHDANGWLIGGQVGCNYQTGNWVFGVQADYDWADATGTSNDLFFVDLTDRSRVRSLGSATARGGYAWDRFLGYVKGGVAWERDNYDTFRTATLQPFSTASSTRTGLTVGIGGEYAFTDFLTAFIEYDYYAFGTRTETFTLLVPSINPLRNTDIRENKSVVKVGFNWKFGWGAVPVVTKY
jgi:outer membrane immunogenic protein